MGPGRGTGSSWLVMRVVITTLSLVLAAVLIARHEVLIGVIIGAMGVVRLVMFVQWRRRRAELAKRYPGRFGGGPPQS